ncbi:unnamed protein product [Pieris brassicae]|uniref:Uncharacterized protein n=1 Tax=Pieris brassicae TaxID=7116 RepID=A0A9P0X9Y9_PIEBR|nr:unnamed protein product [Pieris brassicae]
MAQSASDSLYYALLPRVSVNSSWGSFVLWLSYACTNTLRGPLFTRMAKKNTARFLNYNMNFAGCFAVSNIVKSI